MFFLSIGGALEEKSIADDYVWRPDVSRHSLSLTVTLDDIDPTPRAVEHFLVAALRFVLLAGLRRVTAVYPAPAADAR